MIIRGYICLILNPAEDQIRIVYYILICEKWVLKECFFLLFTVTVDKNLNDNSWVFFDLQPLCEVWLTD